MNGWKVVIDVDGRYFSATWRNPRPDNESIAIAGYHGVEYISGTPTHPKPGYGPLAVFSDQSRAHTFAAGRRLVAEDVTTVVLPCTYRPAKDHALWCPGGNRVGEIQVPEGTEFADEVTVEELPAGKKERPA